VQRGASLLRHSRRLNPQLALDDVNGACDRAPEQFFALENQAHEQRQRAVRLAWDDGRRLLDEIRSRRRDLRPQEGLPLHLDLVEVLSLEGDFAGHSLRAGFATAAARAGCSEAGIMRHGRWKSVQIARRYIRQGARWDDNPAADLGL
jgi:hypothetical protein